MMSATGRPPDSQGSSDLLWDHDPSQVVYTAYNACCFHILFSFMRIFCGFFRRSICRKRGIMYGKMGKGNEVQAVAGGFCKIGKKTSSHLFGWLDGQNDKGKFSNAPPAPAGKAYIVLLLRNRMGFRMFRFVKPISCFRWLSLNGSQRKHRLKCA